MTTPRKPRIFTVEETEKMVNTLREIAETKSLANEWVAAEIFEKNREKSQKTLYSLHIKFKDPDK